jgi:hypothetical protein
LDEIARQSLDARLEAEDEHRLCAREQPRNNGKGKLSAKDLREIGASPRVRRVVAPDGRQRVEISKGHRKEGFGHRAR